MDDRELEQWLASISQKLDRLLESEITDEELNDMEKEQMEKEDIQGSEGEQTGVTKKTRD